MREVWVRVVVVLAGAVMVTLALAFARMQNPGATAKTPAPEAAATSALVQAGRAVYEAQGCAACHSIAGEGNTRLPLDGVGDHLNARELRNWTLGTGEAEEELSPRALRRKQAYHALGEGELSALIAYLLGLKSPRPPMPEK